MKSTCARSYFLTQPAVGGTSGLDSTAYECVIGVHGPASEGTLPTLHPWKASSVTPAPLTVQIFSGSSSCTISGMMSFAYASTKATHWNREQRQGRAS